MARYSVEHNGKWACFSSVSDYFIIEFMDKDKYEEWRLVEYGRLNYEPAEKFNIKTIGDAIYDMSLNHEEEDCIENLIECGIDKAEAIELWNKYNSDERIYDFIEDIKDEVTGIDSNIVDIIRETNNEKLIEQLKEARQLLENVGYCLDDALDILVEKDK